MAPTTWRWRKRPALRQSCCTGFIAIATGGLDALPHNGAVITLLALCKLTHCQAYADIFVVALAVPLLALAVVVTLGMRVGSF